MRRNKIENYPNGSTNRLRIARERCDAYRSSRGKDEKNRGKDRISGLISDYGARRKRRVHDLRDSRSPKSFDEVRETRRSQMLGLSTNPWKFSRELAQPSSLRETTRKLSCFFALRYTVFVKPWTYWYRETRT